MSRQSFVVAAVLLGGLACNGSGSRGSGGATTTGSQSVATTTASANGATGAAASTTGTMGAATSTSGTGGASGSSYMTAFPLTENPISEGGHWINGGTKGLDWHDVSTTPGLAIGHQSGSSYTDGTALLTGTWGPDQTAEAVVHTVNQKDSCYQEVELRLRSAILAHSCTGYEVSFKASKTSSAYLIIVRWNGALGDFSYLSQYMGAQYGVSEGDVVKATITGNVIKAYLNGAEVGSATDSTFTTGNPGMGFNLETGDASCIGTNGDYGFTSYTATSN